MTGTNLALQLQVIDTDTDLDNVMISSSLFSDDIWDLRPFITIKTLKENQKYLKFGYIKNEDMKHTTKLYAYYKLGKVKPMTVRRIVNGGLPMFIKYCSIKGINSFADVTKEDFLDFSIWMKDEKKVAVATGCHSAHAVEDIIKTGQIKGWNVPMRNIFKGVTAGLLWRQQKTWQTNKTKPIPENVFDKILYHAVHDEKDILTKAGIIIQSQTGLRIDEVLSVCKGCVKPMYDGDNVYDYMEVTLGKTEKGEPIIHKVFINELVKDVIAELTEATELLRQESELKELFLIKYRGIRVISVDVWNAYRLSCFIKRWDIYSAPHCQDKSCK
jgi:integrase